jgi:hypothetical protein
VRNALGRGAELVGRVCLLLFLGSLWSVLRAAEEPAGWLAPSAFGGGLTGLAVKLASVGAAAAAQREPRTSALRIALRRINDASFMVSLVPLGVMLGRGGSRSGQRAAAVTLAPAGARQERRCIRDERRGSRAAPAGRCSLGRNGAAAHSPSATARSPRDTDSCPTLRLGSPLKDEGDLMGS